MHYVLEIHAESKLGKWTKEIGCLLPVGTFVYPYDCFPDNLVDFDHDEFFVESVHYDCKESKVAMSVDLKSGDGPGDWVNQLSKTDIAWMQSEMTKCGWVKMSKQ